MRRIRLTEKDLHNMVSESVRRIINEDYEKGGITNEMVMELHATANKLYSIAQKFDGDASQLFAASEAIDSFLESQSSNMNWLACNNM